VDADPVRVDVYARGQSGLLCKHLGTQIPHCDVVLKNVGGPSIQSHLAFFEAPSVKFLTTIQTPSSQFLKFFVCILRKQGELPHRETHLSLLWIHSS
jgi:hypothetical protein